MAPDAKKGWSEVLRLFSDPAVNFFRGEPGAGINFFGVQVEGAFVLATVNPDEFLAGFVACVDAQHARGGAGEVDTELFVDFAQRARIIIFAAINVA